MIRWFLQRATRAFGRKYQYDVSYMLDVIDVSRSAGARLALYPAVISYRGLKNADEVIAGALLASTLDGDCGPCTQLVIDMWIDAGVSSEKLRTCADGYSELAGDVGLGYRFAVAAIAGDLETDRMAQEITKKFGRKGLVAVAYASASGRFYPVFKRSLGHGATCSRLRFGKQEELVLNE
ncbi:hypothetical protein [Parasedimentitalea maritima]|uniref:hypothetical protein n=1 Tax=Parasedimentitalea maritima TaxID=2578117 RepID=UPI001FD81E3A|nr:hypothetical protein [Zongyanglinia marina]